MKNIEPYPVQVCATRLSPRRLVPAHRWHCAMLLVAATLLTGCKPPVVPPALDRIGAIREIEKLGCKTSGSDDHLNIIAEEDFDDAGLAKLPDFTNLEFEGEKIFNSLKLELTGSKVSAAGLNQLERLPNVKTLLLADLPVTDENLKHLAPMRGSLTDLELHGTKITDAGLEHLKTLTLLEYLTVPSTITDAAIANFKLPKLAEAERVPEPAPAEEKAPEKEAAEEAPAKEAAEKTPEKEAAENEATEKEGAEKTPEKDEAEKTSEAKDEAA